MKKPQSKCFCEYIDMGSYDNQVVMKVPYRIKQVVGKPVHEYVCIDSCIASEIAFLWHHGVETLNSCCGHGNSKIASVVVEKKSIPMMRLLGYRNDEEEYPDREDIFILELIN